MSDELDKLKAMVKSLVERDDRPMPKFDTFYMIAENKSSQRDVPGIAVLVLSEPDREIAKDASIYAGSLAAVEDDFQFAALVRKGVPIPSELPGADRFNQVEFESTLEFIEGLASLIGHRGPEMWSLVLQGVTFRAK